MPLPIYILGFTLFAMTTSEFMVAGLMTSMAQDLQVSIPDIGYLITIYSLGMVVGGPLLAAVLIKLGNKVALLTISLLFLAAQSVATFSHAWELLAVARFFTGLSSAAFFGFALLAASKMVDPARFGVAASIVLGGMMVAMVFGLPLSTLLDRYLGWRAAFSLVIVLTALAALGIVLFVPEVKTEKQGSIRAEINSVFHPGLWLAYSTSFFIIAATFAAFSYFVPYFSEAVGFSTKSIPGILFAYGLCSVIGNIIVGRVADKIPLRVIFYGGLLLMAALAGLYALVESQTAVLLSVVMMGLTGITLTPAMSARVFKVTENTSLINTLHTSVICLGVVVGSWGGGYAIDTGLGFRSPFLLGLVLAFLGILTLLPGLFNTAGRAETVEKLRCERAG